MRVWLIEDENDDPTVYGTREALVREVYPTYADSEDWKKHCTQEGHPSTDEAVFKEWVDYMLYFGIGVTPWELSDSRKVWYIGDPHADPFLFATKEELVQETWDENVDKVDYDSVLGDGFDKWVDDLASSNMPVYIRELDVVT
jgi:hypothetical protein